ncbi:serine-rich adhesin for platelets-like [Cherax quadricarinatus]|uniref:serine-rich adhesin for platelets-like n=1 Tax=Cherax quadricarinatus TaxID=27406 RepID=UPI0023785642|nr:uncharacterized protein DDB_G0271670-like [Cherax quadricarinatus]
MEDTVTTISPRARVSRQRLSASLRDDRTRSSSSSSSLSSSSSSSSCSSVSKVAIITSVNKDGGSTDVPPTECPPSVASSPCSSRSSLFSSPSSTSSTCEVKKEGGERESEGQLSTLSVEEEEEESSASGSTSDAVTQSTSAASYIKQVEPIFLRCPKRVEENLAASHSFVRSREEGVNHSLLTCSSPTITRLDTRTTAGDELQVRLNAILHSSRRLSDAYCRRTPTSVPGTKCFEDVMASSSLSELSSSFPPSFSSDHLEASNSAESYESWSLYEEYSRPHSPSSYDPSGYSSTDACSSLYHDRPSSGREDQCSSLSGSQAECHFTFPESENDLQRPDIPLYPRSPRYSIFTISGTLADPFGTRAKYSLRSLSTAHF